MLFSLAMIILAGLSAAAICGKIALPFSNETTVSNRQRICFSA